MPTPYYDKGGITIYHGDCRDVLPSLPPGSVDLVLTDPPYGIAHSSSFGATWQNTTIAGDDDTACRDWALAWARARNIPAACFGSWKIPHPAGTRAILVWDKGPASGMGDLSFPWKLSWEEIYILGEGWKGSRDEGVIRGHRVITWETQGRRHPNEKPVSLMAYLLSKTEAVRVCDPFMGTGATSRAAKDRGLDCIGIEIEERYCEIAARRLEQEVFAWGEVE